MTLANLHPNSPLVIPDHVPWDHRVSTDARHGSFCWKHSFDQWHSREIIICCHALIIAALGDMVVEVGEHSVFLEQGAALMLGETAATITGEAFGEMHVFCFNNDVVRMHLVSPLVESRMCHASREELLPTPVRQFYPAIVHHTKGALGPYPQCLKRILSVLMHEWCPASCYSYLRSAFFGPRLKTKLLLEQGLLNGLALDEDFQRRFRALHRTTPHTWMKARRAELAHHWLRHGEKEVDEIAEHLALSKSEFETVYSQHHRASLEETSRLRDFDRIAPEMLGEEIRPLWLPPAPELCTFPVPAHIQESVDAEVLDPEEVQAFRERFWPKIEPAAVNDFWEMRSTGVGTIVPLPAFLRDPALLAEAA